MKEFIFILVLYLALVDCVYGEEPGSTLPACTTRTNCDECIRTTGCSWCSQSDFHGADKQPLGRCNTTTGHLALGRFACQERFLFTPENIIKTIKDKEIKMDKSNDDSIHMKPQEISVRLATGRPADIEILYQDPEDYPLDLYYLLDLTKTMNTHKETLAKIGNTLGSSLGNLTTKFRQGFGSFIDKFALPFIMMTPENLENPCWGPEETCVRPYAYRNHFKISNDSTKFSQVVSKAPLYSSIDKPEGGFDALMQTMVCNKEIGWGDKGRRLVIFGTDAAFHIAGDGKLGGVIHPNDGNCHLNEYGEYTHSTMLDYPSIAQLNHKAIQNSISIIFAVTSPQLSIYKTLASRIEGAKATELSSDVSNIVNLVTDEYQAITSKIQMSDDLPRQYVNVTYFSDCAGQTIDEERTDTCTDLRIGSTVKFTVRLELIECPLTQGEWNQTYTIYRVGLSDSLVVRLDMICDCPCDKAEDWIPNSDQCSGVGTEKCGLCDCSDDYFGHRCECSATTKGVLIDETTSCKQDNTTQVCSGRGSCYCNQCVCETRMDAKEKYSGTFCECDNFSCEQEDGEICAGHGTCDCGQCQCSQGWNGNACQCSTDTKTCMEFSDSGICSGQGECNCGKCTCQGYYSGDFCEKCRHESCPNKCAELTPCVQCRLYGTGPYVNPADCDLHCSSQRIDIVDVVSYNTNENEVYCKGEDDKDKCSFYFVYRNLDNDHVVIDAQKTKECPPEPPTFWIVVGIVSLIVSIGIGLFLFWKIYTLVQDRKEYAVFKNATKVPDFATDTNPIYNNPIGVYQNPAYGKP